jgi:hypothetical protein
MASPPRSQNWKEKPCSWCNTNLDVLYFSNIYLPLNSIFNNQLSLYLRAKNGIVIRSFFPIFFFQKFGEFLQFSLIFLSPQCKNLSPKYMLLVMYIKHYKSTNDLHSLATTISYEPPEITLMRKWLSFKLI